MSKNFNRILNDKKASEKNKTAKNFTFTFFCKKSNPICAIFIQQDYCSF